jgi:preprotein translocase subunit SecG
MNQLFISYSRKDTEFAKTLTDKFAAQNMEAWVDWQDIPPTVDWMKEIEKGIEEADIFIFIVSPDSIRSTICASEIAHAVRNGKRIVPVVAREIDFKEAPSTLTHLNFIFFSRPQDIFEEALDKLLTAIRTDYDWVKTHASLQVKALEWERNHKERSFLLRGSELADAEAQVRVNVGKSPSPTALQGEYLTTSRANENAEIEEERAKEQQLLLEKKLGSRLRRLTYLLLGVFTVAYIALFFWLNTVTSTMAINSLKDQMLALVETSVCFINGDDYDAFINQFPEAGDEVYEDDYYWTLDSFMLDVIDTNENIGAEVVLYTIVSGNKTNEFLIVNSTDPEADVDYKTSIIALNANVPQIGGLEKTVANTTIYTDDWGTWISACSPILNADDESVGALCADFNAQLLEDTRERVTATLGFAFLAIYPAMIVLVLFATRSIRKPRNSHIKKTP